MLNLDAAGGLGVVNAIVAYIDRTNLIWDGEYLADGFYAGIPILKALGQARSGGRHGWIPEACILQCGEGADRPRLRPTRADQLGFVAPTPAQVQPAMRFLRTRPGYRPRHGDGGLAEDGQTIDSKAVRTRTHRAGSAGGPRITSGSGRPTGPAWPGPASGNGRGGRRLDVVARTGRSRR